MELTIEQSCPSCGAAIVLKEDDKLITCQFCDVANFRLDSTAARYVLPHKLPVDIGSNELLFVPYLRFKGAVYYVEREILRHRLVDTTQLGVEGAFLPPSLGLRPQVMKVRPVVHSMPGSFLLQTIPVKAAFLQATRLVEVFSGGKSDSVVHKAFIGETISVIYQPYYIQYDTVVDAVDGSIVDTIDPDTLHQLKATESKKSWEPSFTGTICSKCGGLLKGQRDSRALVCDNCSAHWLESHGRFKEIKWSLVAGKGRGTTLFPFWKITFSAKGYQLSNFEDLIQFTNQPIIPSQTAKEQELYFLLPAFKINPKVYLQIASQLTMAQNKLPAGRNKKVKNSQPVNLPLSEAVQSVKSVLASLTIGKKKKLQYLPQIKIKVHRTELVYLPFTKNVHDYIQCHTPASIQVAAVKYGRSL